MKKRTYITPLTLLLSSEEFGKQKLTFPFPEETTEKSNLFSKGETYFVNRIKHVRTGELMILMSGISHQHQKFNILNGGTHE